MKFASQHFESLKTCVNNALSSKGITIAEYLKQYEGKSETRTLWDLFWLSGWSTTNREQYDAGNYLDSHIQTAVKNVVRELTLTAKGAGWKYVPYPLPEPFKPNAN